MNEERALVPAVNGELEIMSPEQMAVLKQTIAKDATPEEFKMFVAVCKGTGLNPFAKEIYFVKYQMRNGTTSVAMPVGIDGLRRKAAESGRYAGQVGPFWCGPDGEWRDIWLDDDTPPFACKVGALVHGNPEPTWAVIKWSEFSKVGQRGDRFWKQYPSHQLAIRAESHALRKAVPTITELLQTAGALVEDADYWVAKAEQLQRQRALPRHTPPGDMQEELYGEAEMGQPEEGAPEAETPETEVKKPPRWSADAFSKLHAVIKKAELSSSEWRKLLRLSKEAQASEVMALGSVDEVIEQLNEALEQAVTSLKAQRPAPA